MTIEFGTILPQLSAGSQRRINNFLSTRARVGLKAAEDGLDASKTDACGRMVVHEMVKMHDAEQEGQGL